METKICIKCGIEKPLNEFYFRKDTQCYRNECKSCMLAKQKEIRIEKNKFRKVKKKISQYPLQKFVVNVILKNLLINLEKIAKVIYLQFVNNVNIN